MAICRPPSLCQRHVALRADTIQLHLGRDTAPVQTLSAAKHRLGEGSLRLLRFQLGFLDGYVECDEHGSRIHDLPRRKRDFADSAGQFVAQRDRAEREDRPDRRRRAAVLAFTCHGDCHRLHRLGLICGGLVRFLDGSVFPRAEANPTAITVASSTQDPIQPR